MDLTDKGRLQHYLREADNALIDAQDMMMDHPIHAEILEIRRQMQTLLNSAAAIYTS